MRVAVCDDNAQDIERIMKKEQKPDMYILDIEMPGMDGLAVAKQIRTSGSQ